MGKYTYFSFETDEFTIQSFYYGGSKKLLSNVLIKGRAELVITS